MKSIFHALNRLKVFRGLTEQEFAWVLYDVGNSAFTMLSCSLIPIWFKSLAIGTAPGQINSHQATAYYSIAVAVVTVVVALLGPIFGVLADHKDKKKVLFTTAAALGIFGCILNGFITGWLLFLIIFVFTKICYSASLTIYDSMLNDITSEERMDEVSSYGFAWGYIGSCIPFLIALIAYVLGPDMVGVLPDMLSKGIGFTVTAVWWLLVTIPLIRGFKQRNYVETEGHDIRKAFAEIFHTLKNIATHDKKVLFFLIAFFLYIDGVGTIIDNAINIGTDLNLNTVGQVVFLLATQYIYQTAQIAVRESKPMMRPLVYDFQEDSNVINLEDEYLFGNSMLVAPIMEENQTSRKVYLPEGQWFDFFTNKCYEGEKWIDSDPETKLPVYVKSGTTIQMEQDGKNKIFLYGKEGKDSILSDQIDITWKGKNITVKGETEQNIIFDFIQ